MRWTFDANVAAKFDAIAQAQIPNYDIVIGRCIELARASFPNQADAKIIDVGSARGRTLSLLVDAGFTQAIGVESSPHMAAVSACNDRVIISGQFPLEHGPFDMVIANWTLHFIHKREDYMRRIYSGLKPGGLFVFSERMQASPATYQRYLDFKRSRGVTEAEIKAKEESLKGVLETRPLAWYLDTLNSLGFTGIEIIDAAWCFNTLFCHKPGKTG
jgi:tRNA (cmo5U34)-methyltransferase